MLSKFYTLVQDVHLRLYLCFGFLSWFLFGFLCPDVVRSFVMSHVVLFIVLLLSVPSILFVWKSASLALSRAMFSFSFRFCLLAPAYMMSKAPQITNTKERHSRRIVKQHNIIRYPNFLYLDSSART